MHKVVLAFAPTYRANISSQGQMTALTWLVYACNVGENFTYGEHTWICKTRDHTIVSF